MFVFVFVLLVVSIRVCCLFLCVVLYCCIVVLCAALNLHSNVVVACVVCVSVLHGLWFVVACDI